MRGEIIVEHWGHFSYGLDDRERPKLVIEGKKGTEVTIDFRDMENWEKFVDFVKEHEDNS